jgi:citrate lyase subunit beta/citryl-CoA lyase
MSERPLPKYIRRSLLSLSAEDPKLGEKAYASWADAIILDFARKAGTDWQDDLKSRMPAAIHEAGRGAAEVFVRIESGAAAAALEAVVFPGLAGVVLKGVNEAAEIEKASRCLDTLEDRRGIAAGSLEIDLEVTTAAGVWNSLEIARASERVGTFTINEAELLRHLGMSAAPDLEFEPLEYIKSQLITVATSIDGQAQGMSYPCEPDAGQGSATTS